MPKCHNCKGLGYVKPKKPVNECIKGKCYYCNGTGRRIKKYSRVTKENEHLI